MYYNIQTTLAIGKNHNSGLRKTYKRHEMGNAPLLRLQGIKVLKDAGPYRRSEFENFQQFWLNPIQFEEPQQELIGRGSSAQLHAIFSAAYGRQKVRPTLFEPQASLWAAYNGH